MKTQARHASLVVRIATLMIALLLMISIIPSVSAAKAPDSPSASQYGITEKMTFDVTVVGSEEWQDMDIEQRRDLFRIPEEVYKNMSTEALLMTIIHNPFLVGISAFSHLYSGVEFQSKVYPELAELLEREDFSDTVARCFAAYPDVSFEDDMLAWGAGSVLRDLDKYASASEYEKDLMRYMHSR